MNTTIRLAMVKTISDESFLQFIDFPVTKNQLFVELKDLMLKIKCPMRYTKSLSLCIGKICKCYIIMHGMAMAITKPISGTNSCLCHHKVSRNDCMVCVHTP